MVGRFAIALAMSLALIVLPFRSNGQTADDANKCPTKITIEFPPGQNTDGASNPAPIPNTELDCGYPVWYPAISYRLNEEGVVVLRVQVLADGTLANAQLDTTSQHPRLDDAALRIVLGELRVRPAIRQGRPVTVERQINVTFKIIHRLAGASPSPTGTPTVASAGGAFCLSLMLMSAHELASHCGEPLDPPAEQRYKEAQLTLLTFYIDSNAQLKGHTDPQTFTAKNEQKTSDELSKKDRNDCQKPAYRMWKSLLERTTSVDGLSKLHESLKTASSNTNAIGCL